MLSAFTRPEEEKIFKYQAEVDNISCIALPIWKHVKPRFGIVKALKLSEMLGVLYSVRMQSNWVKACMDNIDNKLVIPFYATNTERENLKADQNILSVSHHVLKPEDYEAHSIARRSIRQRRPNFNTTKLFQNNVLLK